MTCSILLVEDDLKLGGLLQDFLRDQGFSVAWERRGDFAQARILAEKPQLVILDLMLPGQDGLEVCRAVRAEHKGAILMLTARRSSEEQIFGLELGADAYVLKPVEPQLLLAHVKALIRHGERRPAAKHIELGSLDLDLSRREVRYDGEEVRLTTSEFNVLWELAVRAGDVVSREELFRSAIGADYDGLDRAIDVYISRIRRKLQAAGFPRTRLKSVRAAGYLLVP
ncbi:MAG: response regulator [Myxococcota bacterium]